MQQAALNFEPERHIYGVTELNSAIRALLDREFGDVWVTGEISGTKLAASGHYYFALKDEGGQLQCVCFKSAARLLKFKPQDGIAVIARGHIDVYEPRGTYQLIVEHLEPQGYGALQLAFEQLKKKLAAEGLFDAARKRPLPRFPWRIGIVTSPAGAVIQDMLNILRRRLPGLHIRIYPAQVQGAGSVESVCEGIEYFSRTPWADVLIVARGGGSVEDLWTFNEEAVARAIAACPVPVVSAIGHETDFTIADFVADLRAPTPSAAAELVVRTREELLESIAQSAARLAQVIRYRLGEAKRRLQERGIERARALLERNIGRAMQRVDEMEYRLRQSVVQGQSMRRERWRLLDDRLRRLDLRLRFSAAHRRIDAAHAACAQAIAAALGKARRAFEPLAAKLDQLSPLRILERGYAIVQDAGGQILKDASATEPGAELKVRLAKGRLEVTVDRISG